MFLGNFNNIEDVAKEFDEEDILSYEIIVASYFYEDYEGAAYVLAKRDGVYYEVHARHCSCNGLEGDWEPDIVDLNYLRLRVNNGRFGPSTERGDETKQAVKAWLDSIN